MAWEVILFSGVRDDAEYAKKIDECQEVRNELRVNKVSHID